jgi:tetratricopeptide (TPR) repeat protein
MSSEGAVATQVLLVAQVFLIGLATLEIQNDVLARFRDRLDRLRQDALDLDICEFDPVRTHRIARRAQVLGIELEPPSRWYHLFGLWPQLLFSLASFALLIVVLWQEGARANLASLGNPLSDYRYSAGYAILGAEFLLLAMFVLHIQFARRSLRRLADAVVAAIGDSDEARFVVAPGLGRLDFGSIPQPRISPQYAPTGDVARALHCAAYVAEATLRRYGRRDPVTLLNSLSYAVRLSEAGKLQEATSIAKRVADRLEELKPGSVDQAVAFLRLAQVHRRAGSTAQAVSYARDSHAELLRLLGNSHPDTLDALDELVESLDSAGDYKGALALLEDESAHMGRQGRASLRGKAALARALMRVGRYSEAVEMHAEIVSESKKELGEEHRETLRSRKTLAAAYYYVGSLEEAQRENEEVLEVQSRVLGPEHPDTLGSRNNLAVIYQASGRYGDALRENEEVVRVQSRVLGSDHPNTLLTRHNLAATYKDIGRLDDALRVLEDVVDKRSRVLGPENPATLDSRNNLGVIFWEVGRLEEAVRVLEDVLEKRSRVLGPEDPETLRSRRNLAAAYRELGRFEDAALEDELARTRLSTPERERVEEDPM